MNDLTKNHALGKDISFISVIEFQKRGLPHAHILLILDEKDKLRNTDYYDNIVKAELPDKTEDPNLYECIVKHNIHNQCGKFNKQAVCMVDGKCSKRFPKPLKGCTI